MCIRDSHKAHGTINMADALRQSCNLYYIQLGQRVGSQQFYNCLLYTSRCV